MVTQDRLIYSLNTLNKIVDTLNRAEDIPTALNQTLTRLVDLMGLSAGWIFLKDPSSQNQWAGRGYVLAAHYNLPPAMAPGKPRAWKGGCDCQGLCNKEQLAGAYNEVRCSRLAATGGDKHGLTVHASAPLRSGDKILGILNVAGPNWDTFTEESLALLTNIGSQMGLVLERSMLLEMLQEQRIHEQAALLRLSSKLLDFDQGLEKLMAYVAEEVRELLHADACALLMPQVEDPSYLVFSAASGWTSNPIADCHLVPADERSGAGLVMQIQQPLLIEDLEETYEASQMANGDNSIIPASWTSSWLQTEGFRGHAVVPLIVDGNSIGAIVINMRKPRLIDEQELRFLRLMANQAAIAIEKSRLHMEKIKRERLEEELSVGQQIQQSLLPERDPNIAGWQFATFYKSAQQVGGDFYDFFQLPGRGNRLGMVIADASGKGVSGALFMALSRSILRTKALTGRNPLEVLRRSNRLIYRDSRSSMFLTIFYGILDVASGHFVFTNAGHNRPLWYRTASRTMQELVTEGIVLGVFERVRLGEDTINIEPGDLLVCYTDGITEAMNVEGELFGERRLEAVIAANAGCSTQQMVDAIVAAVVDFTGETPQADDLTLFVVKRDE